MKPVHMLCTLSVDMELNLLTNCINYRRVFKPFLNLFRLNCARSVTDSIFYFSFPKEDSLAPKPAKVRIIPANKITLPID